MNVKLLVVRGQPQGKSLLFPQGEFVIGRGDECHIRPNSSWVSRQHCMLRITDEALYLRDLGSTNGTLVNGSRLIGECPLVQGDQIQVGPLVFEVHLEKAVAAAPGPSKSDTGMHQTIDTAEGPALPDVNPTPTPQNTTQTDLHPAVPHAR
jgi:predicted component of type VI protein secretion system